MILTSSPFEVVAYPAASRAGIATLSSSLRPCHYIILTLAAELLGCIFAYNKKPQTNKKQIQQWSGQYGTQRNSTSNWLWSDGGQTHAKAICTGPHPITRKKEKRTANWSLSSTIAASLGGCDGITQPASEYSQGFLWAPNSYRRICFGLIELDNERSNHSLWSRVYDRLLILPTHQPLFGEVHWMAGLSQVCVPIELWHVERVLLLHHHRHV